MMKRKNMSSDETSKTLKIEESQEQQKLLIALSENLSNTFLDPLTRQQAGILLKNAIYLDAKADECQKKWFSLSEKERLYIRENCFYALKTEVKRPLQAGQCIAAIISIDLPHGVWFDIVRLCMFAEPQYNEMLRVSSLETIGYICQSVKPNILAKRSNLILSALSYGMCENEHNDNVKLAALNTFCYALEFIENHFTNQNEKDYIMGYVFKAIESRNIQIAEVALEILVKIMCMYCKYLDSYRNALFEISTKVMTSNNKYIAYYGVEFWMNVCTIVIDSNNGVQQLQDRTLKNFINDFVSGAMNYILPILLQHLTNLNSDNDVEYNLYDAVVECLNLLSSCANISEHMVPFIKEIIKIHPRS